MLELSKHYFHMKQSAQRGNKVSPLTTSLPPPKKPNKPTKKTNNKQQNTKKEEKERRSHPFIYNFQKGKGNSNVSFSLISLL